MIILSIVIIAGVLFFFLAPVQPANISFTQGYPAYYHSLSCNVFGSSGGVKYYQSKITFGCNVKLPAIL